MISWHQRSHKGLGGLARDIDAIAAVVLDTPQWHVNEPFAYGAAIVFQVDGAGKMVFPSASGAKAASYV